MKNIILALLIPISSFCYGQKYKTIDICKSQYVKISGMVKYDNQNQPIDTFYSVMGRDSRYTHIIEFFYIIDDGKLDQIRTLFVKAQEVFQNEEKGTTVFFNDHMLSINRVLGIKYISIGSNKQTELGTVQLGMQHLNKIIADIDRFNKTKNKL